MYQRLKFINRQCIYFHNLFSYVYKDAFSTTLLIVLFCEMQNICAVYFFVVQIKRFIKVYCYMRFYRFSLIGHLT